MKDVKNEKVKSIFTSIASQYDLINDIISFGMIRYWRRLLIKEINPMGQESVDLLDIATGTGDVILAAKKALKNQLRLAIGVDNCEAMISRAPRKATLSGHTKDELKFQVADASALPFENNSFDYVTIAYGLRNFSQFQKSLEEIERVLRPNGRLLILETGRSDNSIFGTFFKIYFSYVMPFLGGLLSGDRKAYQYLFDSSENFLYGKELVAEIKKTRPSFKSVQLIPLALGVSYIYHFQVKK